MCLLNPRFVSQHTMGYIKLTSLLFLKGSHGPFAAASKEAGLKLLQAACKQNSGKQSQPAPTAAADHKVKLEALQQEVEALRLNCANQALDSVAFPSSAWTSTASLKKAWRAETPNASKQPPEQLRLSLLTVQLAQV